jgi:hypothetical protein
VLLDPIVSRIREVGLTASKIHTDDTPVPMLDPDRGKTATRRLGYRIPDCASGADPILQRASAMPATKRVTDIPLPWSRPRRCAGAITIVRRVGPPGRSPA